MIYICGSLKQTDRIISTAQHLQAAGFEVFEQWISAGPNADDHFWTWAKRKGLNARDALQTAAARHIFDFDNYHIQRAKMMVAVMPFGKSGGIELGVMLGSGRRGYILMDGEPERIDQMFQYATGIAYTVPELVTLIRRDNLKEIVA